MAKMSSDNLKNNLTNVAKAFLWEAMFVNPIGGGDSETLNVRCQSTSQPGRSFGVILVPYKQGPGVKFPGRLTMSHTWPTTFIEGTDGKIFDAIYDWMQAIVHDRLNIGGPDVLIKADMYFNLLDSNGKITKKIKIIGAYPELLDETPVTYGNDAGIIYSCTWSYDRWELVK
jgi:hypothetical protein